MLRFNISLAGHTVGILSRFEKNRELFKDYIIDDTVSPEIEASITDDEIRRTTAAMPEVSSELAEFTGLYRPIAEAMPDFGGFVFHGAAISYGGMGYIFTAPSGTGKSTHIRLWRRYLGKSVDIINGDKPIITVTDHGVFVHGTPWAGKERWQKNRTFPLGGICLMERGVTSSAKDADISENLPFLFGQTYISQNPEVTGKTMELLDRLLRDVKLCRLSCDISEDAVRCAFEKLTGLNYDEAKDKYESDGFL